MNNKITVAELRKKFVEFYKEKNHTHVPSSALIPVGDATLLFTTAGMVQFKSNYVNPANLDYTRAVSIQKCLRTTDLDIVGTTDRHCTFFEMLGNFSFGDYFKEEAITFAWEFSLQKLKLDENKIWVSIFEDDDEAYSLWEKNIGINPERIVRLGAKDNFWGPAGNSGPCGPCSELYYDRGLEYGCGCETCKPGCECDRFIEFWNLVFVQYHQDAKGQRKLLENPGIDTGAGLERIACLLQDVISVYDTDELQKMIEFTENLTGRKYSENTKAFRVLSDHIRSASFAIADGALPSNEGRGYVIRRIIRRAAVYARKLGQKKAFFHSLLPLLVEIYGEYYPELAAAKERIQEVLLSEEERFLLTLEKGMKRFENIVKDKKKGDGLSGKEAFILYDTYGFPLELTIELAEENSFSVDLKEFENEMEVQRQKAREDWSSKDSDILSELDESVISNLARTEFTGYKNIKDNADLLYYQIAKKDETGCILVFNKTPFYARSGGQIGDSGIISKDDIQIKIVDTIKRNDLFFHIGKLQNGSLNENDTNTSFRLLVDKDKRNSISRHHSATHLLNAALRNAYGNDIVQTGSLVADNYFRFDFSFSRQLKEEELTQIERSVNHAINLAKPVITEVLSIEEAKKSGAVANFEEKYGNKVRVVSMGKESDKSGVLSRELCGGVHVSNTAEIQKFMIEKQSSPGAGNRRIEAICSDELKEYISERRKIFIHAINYHNDIVKEHLNKLGLENGVSKSDQPELAKMIEDSYFNLAEYQERMNVFFLNYELRTDFSDLRKFSMQLNNRLKEAKLALNQIENKVKGAGVENYFSSWEEEIKIIAEANNDKIFIKLLENEDSRDLKSIGDKIKQKFPSMVSVFLNSKTDKLEIVVMAGKEIVKSGFHSGNFIKKVLENLNGRGGGKPDTAQGGGDKPENLAAFSETVRALFSTEL